MRESIDGLILSQTPLRESDKFLTVLTAKYGKISVYANHVRSIKRGALPYSVPMQYCRFIVEKKRESFNLADGEVLHSFLDISQDLCRFALAQYVLNIALELTCENTNESDMLSLTLNTLFVIQKANKPLPLIKATFEFRAMAIAGYMPDISECGICGAKDSEQVYFDIMNGRLLCKKCAGIAADIDQNNETGTAFIICPLTASMLRGLRYVLSSQANRVFSYSISEDELGAYAQVCEKYITNHLERGFLTLDFYHETMSLAQ